jgi:hypothetical protein
VDVGAYGTAPPVLVGRAIVSQRERAILLSWDAFDRSFSSPPLRCLRVRFMMPSCSAKPRLVLEALPQPAERVRAVEVAVTLAEAARAAPLSRRAEVATGVRAAVPAVVDLEEGLGGMPPLAELVVRRWSVCARDCVSTT